MKPLKRIIMEANPLNIQKCLEEMLLCSDPPARLRSVSLQSRELYGVLNKYLGCERLVQERRKMMAFCTKAEQQLLKSIDFDMEVILSGSSAEGFDFPGSDIDIMFAFSKYKVYVSETPNIVPAYQEIILTADSMSNSVYPGFVIVKALHAQSRQCIGIWKSSDFLNLFVRNISFFGIKMKHHGPCASFFGYTNDADFAACLPCDDWPEIAQEWLHRKRHNKWPSRSTVRPIVNGSCYLVPISYKGSSSADEEWRISFSKAEKRLIFSFNHAQFLTYGLLKIVLKDIINSNFDVEGILCSYFMKTILFWTIEESSPNIWTPERFLIGFWLCFMRLIENVKNRNCPNYFLRRNNMFKIKFTESVTNKMLNLLLYLKWKGINFLFASQTIATLTGKNTEMSDVFIEREISHLHMNEICKISYGLMLLYGDARMTDAFHDISSRTKFKQYVRLCSKPSKLSRRSKRITKQLLLQNICHVFDISKSSASNKIVHLLQKLLVTFLIQGTKTDLSAGRLLLASWLYKQKRYYQCLHVVDDALENIKYALYYNKTSAASLQTNDRIEEKSCGMNISSDDKARLFFLNIVIVQLTSQIALPEFNELGKFLGFDPILKIGYPPNLFGRFLKVLCYHRLGQYQKRNRALQDMKLESPLLSGDPVFTSEHNISYFLMIITYLYFVVIPTGDTSVFDILDFQAERNTFLNAINTQRPMYERTGGTLLDEQLQQVFGWKPFSKASIDFLQNYTTLFFSGLRSAAGGKQSDSNHT